jgi:predicted transcriptional regulator
MTLMIEDEHDIYLKSLARRWKQSRSWVVRRILDDAMRRVIEPFDIDQTDNSTDDSDT